MVLFLSSCEDDKRSNTHNSRNWKDKFIEIPVVDSLVSGQTYLSVYSEIYSISEHRTHDLTATISMRNTSREDTLYVVSCTYFNTKGKKIRSYIPKPIFLTPMETVEIVIGEKDLRGGSGANFVFDWVVKTSSSEPLFEAVMISTSGTQGLSFISTGKKLVAHPNEQ